jgi:(2Fe-2S) ferredoxin
MKAQASICPKLHLFVCANERDESDPLGSGCGARGEVVYAALKAEVAKRGDFRGIWVTKTHCLGICPKRGCTVAEYPRGVMWRDVDEGDVTAFFDLPSRVGGTPPSRGVGSSVDGGPGDTASDRLEGAALDVTLAKMEKLQADKVIELARRLRPGLTAEDIRNPHDFPELDDHDWHYEDGILTGIQSVMTALRAGKDGGRSGEDR